MIDLECPSCGRAGSIPREKINTRLVCKKCRRTFHMNAAGRTLLGEPPVVDPTKPEHHAPAAHLPKLGEIGLKETFSGVPVKPLGLAALALAVVWGIWTFLARPPESLAERSKFTAERFAADDLAYLKEIATADTVDDIVRWFDVVHPVYVKTRDEWKNKATEVRVMVIDENRKQRTGEAEAFVYPVQGSVHTASIANAAAAADAVGPVAIQPMDLKLHWALDGGGRWRLDGRSTFLAASRTP